MDSFNATLTALQASNNKTAIKDFLASCTLATCPIEYAQVRYQLTLFGNALYLAIFATFLVIQLAEGSLRGTWSFTGAMFGGLALEITGYYGRIMLHNNPFDHNAFLL